MNKSSKTLKYVGRYGLLVFSILLIGNSLFFTFQGLQTDNWNMGGITGTGIFGLLFFIAFLYLRNKFVVVELSGQIVRIITDKEIIDTNWQNVESIDRINFSSPPLYLIKIKDTKGYFIFWVLTINIFWFDHSEMGELISQKKKKLDI